VPPLVTDLWILALLVVANGLLAMAETAVVSARRSRLREWAAAGDKRAARALALAQQPVRFLELVQFWLTLSGMIAGVLAGARIYGSLTARLLHRFGPWAPSLSFATVTIGLSAFMLLFGELVPKRIGLAYPEKVATLLAGLMRALAWLASPFLLLLERLTDSLASLAGLHRPPASAQVAEEDVRALVEQGLHAGVFQRAEKEMVEGVLALDQIKVTALMTPRPKIVFLNIDDPEDTNWRKIVASGHSYFPVFQGNRDQIVGLVAVKALWAHSAIGLPATLRNLLVQPLMVPETMTAIQVLERFKKSGRHLAMVTDEFGAVQGLVTLIDVFQAIVGDLPEQGQRTIPEAKPQNDGSYVLDATLPIADLKSLLGVTAPLPQESAAEFQTVGGFVVTQFGRIPNPGDRFAWDKWNVEVMEMDRRRVDKVRFSPRAPAPAASE
jgi:putative hemolysin